MDKLENITLYNIDKIIIIQKFYKNYVKLYIFNKNFMNYYKYIYNNIIKYNKYHNILFIKCKKIHKTYSPSKNENKFIFGNLIQLSVIDFLNKIFKKCIDLDELHTFGSEFKNDCILFLTNNVNFYLSIKCKSKKQGDIIIINKHSNNINYLNLLNNLITIVIIVENNDILIINHNIVDKKYIKDNEANVSYKSSLITYMYKFQKNYIIHLETNDNFKNFLEYEYNNIQPINIYKILYDKL